MTSPLSASAEFDGRAVQGLSAREAAARLQEDGFNELPSSRRRSIFAIAFDVVREPMFLLLVACGTIYLVVGDLEEALMLLGFVFVVMGITLYQERKTERALEALRDLSSPRALVIRDGEETRIAGREVVRGDMLILKEGDRVPADALMRSARNLSVDESLLTGESVPVRKAATPDSGAMSRPGGDDLPSVYSSTLIVQGHGIAEVQAIGIHTEIGKIGKALQSVESETTYLNTETRRLVRNLTVVGLVLCALVVTIYGLTRGDWLQGFLAGLTLAMATLPEEIPVVLTVFLALGAWRISQKQVLTRRVPAIESLGSATVLCVDKTGTLTVNRMSVARLYADGSSLDISDRADSAPELPEAFHTLVEYGVLASQKDPFDPMDKAIRRLGERELGRTEHWHEDWELVREYPLSTELLALSHVWRSLGSSEYVIAAKGAPEAIVDLCHLPDAERASIARTTQALAESGLRVLGVAMGRFRRETLPGQQHDFDFEFRGLMGLADPVRPTVPASITECREAGIRVVMITGDYAGTAQNIARQIGLQDPERFINGPDLDQMDDDELQRRIGDVNIFARVVPEQKLRIVNALKARGEIVAMTGDGVNDAPALKSAHIGIAMGGRGTDVARESASLVLLDDDFSSIVKAVKLGRRIFDNIRKSIGYIFAVHVPIAGMSLIPVLLKWPLALLPVHVVFLELIIDPACSVVFEAEREEADVMKRPPRRPKEPLLSGRNLLLSLLQGLSVLAVVLAVYSIALDKGLDDGEARAMGFVTMIVANLGLILTNRSWSRTLISTLRTPNAALWWVLGGATTFLTLVLTIPFLRRLFHFEPLHGTDLAICLVAGALSILWFEGAQVRAQTAGVVNAPL